MRNNAQSDCHVKFEHFTQTGQELLNFTQRFIYLVSITTPSSNKEDWEYTTYFDMLNEQMPGSAYTDAQNSRTSKKSASLSFANNENKPVFLKSTRLSSKGHVQIETKITYRLHTKNKHPATYNIICNFTNYTKLYDLFLGYRYYYANTDQAMQRFLDYWKLNDYFLQPLTSMEFLTLLVLIQEQSPESNPLFVHIIAHLVSTYLPVIKAKLKPTSNLHKLLCIMSQKSRTRIAEFSKIT